MFKNYNFNFNQYCVPIMAFLPLYSLFSSVYGYVYLMGMPLNGVATILKVPV